MKKVLSLVLCLVCLMCACVPGLAEDTQTDFLARIQGTYVELFPELAKEEYHQAWLDSVTPIVGEDAAEETVAYLLSVCMAQTYGPEAAAQYESDPESMRFDCYFIGGVKKMTVEGNVIFGVDENGQEVFRHTYAPMVLDNENGFIFYRTEDADAGQFTYFAFSPDTMEDTWHLEFRYAEDTADLMSWFEGNYAYWNVGAIAENYTQEEILSAIHLVAAENLAEEE